MGNGIPKENVSYTPEGMKIVSLNGAENILIKSFEFNLKSDTPNGDDVYIGLVMYAYDGKSSWYCNGKYCQSGFIILKKLQAIQQFPSYPYNSSHARLYKWYFGVDPDYKKVIAAGFAYRTYTDEIKNNEGKVVDRVERRGLVFRSNTFNAITTQTGNDSFKNTEFQDYKDEWHDEEKAMNAIEQHWVEKAYYAWKGNDYRPKKVYCHAADWQFRKDDGWCDMSREDSIWIETEYQKYKNLKSSSDDEKFEETAYSVTKYINYTRYTIYFNAPHIKKDMYGYEAYDGYQKSDKGCIRALNRSSNEYTGAGGGCVIL